MSKHVFAVKMILERVAVNSPVIEIRQGSMGISVRTANDDEFKVIPKPRPIKDSGKGPGTVEYKITIDVFLYLQHFFPFYENLGPPCNLSLMI